MLIRHASEKRLCHALAVSASDKFEPPPQNHFFKNMLHCSSRLVTIGEYACSMMSYYSNFFISLIKFHLPNTPKDSEPH